MPGMYSDKVMEHFQNPRNVGRISDADGIGEVGNPVCGDVMKMFIKVDGGRIQDVKFQTLGCGAAIATSSITTEMAKGKTLLEALKITRDAVAHGLDGLPPNKMHCSNLAADALHEAIRNYVEINPDSVDREILNILENFPKPKVLEGEEHEH